MDQDAIAWPKLKAETIVRTDYLMTAFNPDAENIMHRFVVLECGHTVRTANVKRAHCPRCQKMLESGEDYDGFRHHGLPDEMAWPEDPCRHLNEPTDLAGNFLRDP